MSKVRRPPLQYRGWLNSTMYDRLVRPTVLHADLFAFVDTGHNAWFMVELREAGKRTVARSHWRIDGAGDIVHMNDLPDHSQRRRLFWHVGTRELFEIWHPFLLREARAGLTTGPWTKLSIHCHYVLTSDVDPFAGVVNLYARRRSAQVRSTNAAPPVATRFPWGIL